VPCFFLSVGVTVARVNQLAVVQVYHAGPGWQVCFRMSQSEKLGPCQNQAQRETLAVASLLSWRLRQLSCVRAKPIIAG
jgi:hypothetical protein